MRNIASIASILLTAHEVVSSVNVIQSARADTARMRTEAKLRMDASDARRTESRTRHQQEIARIEENYQRLWAEQEARHKENMRRLDEQTAERQRRFDEINRQFNLTFGE